MPTARPRPRPRLALVSNDLLSTYQVALSGAIERAALARGFDVVAVMGREIAHEDPAERAQNVVYGWVSPDVVDGAIVLTGTLANFCGMDGLRRLERQLSPLPMVSVGIALPGVPSLTVDNRAGTRAAIEHLIAEHGCRRVAYIAGPEGNEEAHARLLGYRDALEAHGLGYDERLVRHGMFNWPTGIACARELLDQGLEIDAVAAANDYMALAAIDVLRERGRRVPEQVRVVGFDSGPVARFAPRSLTSVAQPLEAMAGSAVDTLLALMAGEPAPTPAPHRPELDLRQSCGCGYARRTLSAAHPGELESPDAFSRRSRDALRRRLLGVGASAGSWWQDRVDELLDALSRELAGAPGELAHSVETIAERAEQAGVAVEKIGQALLQVQRHFDAAGYGEQLALERMWAQALDASSAANVRAEGRRGLDLIELFIQLRRTNQAISIALEHRTLADELAHRLPRLGVRAALVATLSKDAPGRLQPIYCSTGHDTEGDYPISTLWPAAFPGPDVRSLRVMPLTFRDEVLGVLAIDAEADVFVCENLRVQVGAALKLGATHRRVVEETAARERLARSALEGEVAIAKRIQSALEPKHHQVPGLDISASATPADQVGGDYYDIVPVPGGAWLAIGDVTGHGLLSGLIMLMIQSILGTLVRRDLDERPGRLVADLNRGLVPNLRERLAQDEFATLVLLRYYGDGRVRFAGAHESIIVCRAATGRCEQIPTSGVWIGIKDDIEGETPDQQLQLEPGDLLVLYTDGLIEARNAQNEMFDLERVCALIEAHAQAEPEAIRAALLEAVRAWTPVQQDDVTLIVARYTPSPSAS